MEPIVFPLQTKMTPADLGVGQLDALRRAASDATSSLRAAEEASKAASATAARATAAELGTAREAAKRGAVAAEAAQKAKAAQDALSGASEKDKTRLGAAAAKATEDAAKKAAAAEEAVARSAAAKNAAQAAREAAAEKAAAVQTATEKARAAQDAVAKSEASKKAAEEASKRSASRAAEHAQRATERAAKATEAATKRASKSATAEVAKTAKATETATKAGTGIKDLASGANAANGPLGGLLGKLQGLGGAAGTTSGGIGLIVGVALAAAAAVLALSAAVTKFAFDAADAARSTKLLNAAFAGSEMPEFDSVIRQLGSKIPLARDKIGEMARGLRDARLEGIDLQRALTAMGLAAVVRGSAAEGAIRAIAEQSAAARRFMLGARDIYGQFASLKGTGIKAADIYAALAQSMKISLPQAKALIDSGRVSLSDGLKALEIASQKAFGPLAAAHAISFSNQMAKLKENLTGLFANVDIEPFLRGLATVTSLFDESTFTGFALKQVVTEAFSAMFSAASKAFPYIRAAVIGVAIGLIYVYGFIKRTASAISDFLSRFDISGPDALTYAMYAGMGAVGAIIGTLTLLAGVLAVIGASVLAASLPFLIFVAIVVAVIAGVIYAVNWLKNKIAAIGEYLSGLNFSDTGSNLVRSIADGITSGAAWVLNAIKDLAKRAGRALLAAFEIASPSKLGLRVGRNVGRSVGTGAAEEAPAVGAAMAKLSSAAVAAPVAAGATRGGGGNVGQIGPFYFSVDSEERAREIARRVLDLFEQAALEVPA